MAKILVGITGGIAAYKIADLAHALVKKNYSVRVVMTENAKRFITPLTLATLSKNPVMDDTTGWAADGTVPHIELGKWADLIVIAPATATTIAKMAYGIADNLLTSIYLARGSTKHVMIFPAMNTKMLEEEITQKNIMDLALRPFHKVIQPDEGLLACGDVGKGKLPSVDKILEEIESQLYYIGA
jgi:phosphopantothenoylcysteine decarboxylase/phosphopantothenate--cysteine ligase